jgi:hypothetical protein
MDFGEGAFSSGPVLRQQGAELTNLRLRCACRSQLPVHLPELAPGFIFRLSAI